jgi:hypothetical protein
MGFSVSCALSPSLKSALRQRKKAILHHWRNRVLDGYGADSAGVLGKSPDRFANPLAFAFNEAGEAIFRIIMNDPEADGGALDYAVKIRAVQEPDPAKAVAFIYLFRDAALEELDRDLPECESIEFRNNMERIALTALETFFRHRGRIVEIGRRCAPERRFQEKPNNA